MNKLLYSKLSKAELAEIFPPITRNNFVVRDNWFGRNQIITFEKLMYDHGSPGKVFLLDEKSMEDYLDRLERDEKNFKFNNFLRFQYQQILK